MAHGVGLVSDSDSEIIAQVRGQRTDSGCLAQSQFRRPLTLSCGTEILCSPPKDSHSEHVHGIDFPARIKAFMAMSATAYSLVALSGGAVYAVRDPFGNIIHEPSPSPLLT